MAHTTASPRSSRSNILAGDDFAAGSARSHDAAPALTRTVVFTDVVDSTSLIDTLGDDEWLDIVQAHHALAWEVARHLGAEHVKSTGDGVFAVFGDAANALSFGGAMIEGMAQAAADGRCAAVGLKVGIAAGAVHRMFGDYHGRTMHLAARLCAAAGPGGILVSAACCDTLPGPNDILGKTHRVNLRGFAGTEAVHRLGVGPTVTTESPARRRQHRRPRPLSVVRR